MTEGSPSGIAATPILMDKRINDSISLCLIMPRGISRNEISITITDIILPNVIRRISRGVFSISIDSSVFAICPRRVWIPILVTLILQCPLISNVPLYTSSLYFFPIGSDSPVSSDSSTSISGCVITIPSAGIYSPSVIIIISSGTISIVEICCSLSFRMTLDTKDVSFFNFSKDFSALYS